MCGDGGEVCPAKRYMQTVGSEVLGAWQYVFPARRFGSLLRRAILVRQKCFACFGCACLQGFSDTLKVGLLVFPELWLRMYPLSCGSG